MRKKTLQFLKIWRKSLILAFQDAMAYKGAFFILVLSLFLGDLIIPIVSTLIYQVSAGIPGWSLYEFILFQGSLIIVIGLWHTFFAGLLGDTIVAVKDGTYDKILLKPFNSLAYMTTRGFDLEGIGEILAGLLIVGFALVKLHFFNWMLLAYAVAILLGALFEYALTIIAASLAFIFVKTWRLYELISSVERFGRYPMGVYNEGIRWTITFIIPVAAASYYPASILLGKEPLIKLAMIAIPVMIFFIASLLCWKFAMRKYGSAGG
jgi:ABC-2 type transport system permease protein